jgi:hypothetical protein
MGAGGPFGSRAEEAISNANARETQTAENDRSELNVAAGLHAHRQQRYVVALWLAVCKS